MNISHIPTVGNRGGVLRLSTPSHKYGGIRSSMHPDLLRCSSVTPPTAGLPPLALYIVRLNARNTSPYLSEGALRQKEIIINLYDLIPIRFKKKDKNIFPELLTVLMIVPQFDHNGF